MKDKQTAVEWLKDKLFELEIKIDSKAHEEAFFIFEQAKQIEKEQIIGANNDGALMTYALPFNAPFKKGEEYYNETYGSQAPQRLEKANGE
jgi:hypothetical protein